MSASPEVFVLHSFQGAQAPFARFTFDETGDLGEWIRENVPTIPLGHGVYLYDGELGSETTATTFCDNEPLRYFLPESLREVLDIGAEEWHVLTDRNMAGLLMLLHLPAGCKCVVVAWR